MKNESFTKAIQQWLGTGSINIFGRPFAGKDTQGRMLASLFNGTLLGGGEILRGSTMPDHIKAAMKTGTLLPTTEYISIVLPYLSQPEFANQPLILSSVGRWFGEERGVIDATAAAQHPIKAVIFLNLSEAEVIRRWRSLPDHSSRGTRYDDTEEILQIRLKEFRDKTLPVIDYYREQGMLIEVDGSMTTEAVQREIIAKLYQLSRG